MPSHRVCNLGLGRWPKPARCSGRLSVAEFRCRSHAAAGEAMRARNRDRVWRCFRCPRARRAAAGTLSGGEQQMLANRALPDGAPL